MFSICRGCNLRSIEFAVASTTSPGIHQFLIEILLRILVVLFRGRNILPMSQPDWIDMVCGNFTREYSSQKTELLCARQSGFACGSRSLKCCRNVLVHNAGEVPM